MKPLRTSLLVIGTVAVITSGYYYTTRTQAASTATQQQHTVAASAKSTKASGYAALGAARRPSFNTQASTTAAATPQERVTKKGIQSPDNIAAQTFRVNAKRDTVIKTAAGCTLEIPAHAFVDANGKAAKGAVNVAVKEVLKPADYVLGNMMTLYNGKPLESGGTFCISASAGGEELALAKDAALNMAVPTRAKKSGMRFFPGEEGTDGVKWLAPQEMQAPVVEQLEAPAVGAIVIEPFVQRTNVTYSVKGFRSTFDAPKAVHDEVSRIAWTGAGMWLKQDSTFMVLDHEVTFYANEKATSTNGWGIMNLDQSIQTGPDIGAVNTFAVDQDANYVFQVKKLGWANIDRLLCDKRTKPVEIITNVINNDGKEDLHITLVMKSHGLYIPGYEKKDGSYGFSHGDYEQMRLPVGAKATVLCTAKKDGKPWYAMQEITIAEKGNLDLDLQPTTTEELRKRLMTSL